ncbi:MAG: class I SAM-dependent methyltransferase [Spirochaetales bacterium]|nr:class I SAM-dependent methyltransferase [Spirochaetales bacterium]
MLSNSQYASSKKYEARLDLHRRFSTNPKSKYVWIFEHFPKTENLKVLELGCGTGLFWLANRNQIPKTWSVILTDTSKGMLETARNSLSRINHRFQYEEVNAEDISYPDHCFDIILANNMLYHLENRSNALSHIRRILKDVGVFITSTMGKNDLFELHIHLYHFLESRNNHFRFGEFSFSLENGMEQLTPFFSKVSISRHENTLRIDEVEPVIDYYLSFNGIYNDVVILPEEDVEAFREYLQRIIDSEKVISATKDSGIFICTQ